MTRILLDERNILWLIILNAVVIFALGFQDITGPARHSLEVLDDAFTVVFVLELLVKVRAWTWRTYIASHWNKLDFGLVVLALPALLSYVVDVGATLDFLLVLRVLRVFKFFRFLRFIPGIDHLVAGVVRAIQASVLLILAFFVGLVMVSLVSAKLYGHVSPEHFGDPLVSMYSIFKIFTVEGWFEIPDAVADELTGPAAFFTRVYFMAMLLGAGVMGLSLVNSVFVDAMVADNNDDLEKKVDLLVDEVRALRAELAGRPPEPPVRG